MADPNLADIDRQMAHHTAQAFRLGLELVKGNAHAFDTVFHPDLTITPLQIVQMTDTLPTQKVFPEPSLRQIVMDVLIDLKERDQLYGDTFCLCEGQVENGLFNHAEDCPIQKLADGARTAR